MPSARRAFPRQAIPVVLRRVSARPGGALTGAFRQACVVEKKDPATRHCLNCSAAKKSKTAHSSTDTSCPFWSNRFDRDWLKRQFSRVAK
jgi:hypothetical protein